MSAQVEPLKPHLLLNESGNERLAIFRGEHSDRIGGMDCLTVAVEVPSEGLCEHPRSIARWTACGPGGLIEVTLEFMEQWAQAARSRLPWQPIAFAFSGSSVSADSESGLAVGTGPRRRAAISAVIDQDPPSAPGDRKVRVAVVDVEEAGNRENVFGQNHCQAAAAVMARDIGNIVSKYVAKLDKAASAGLVGAT